MASDEIVWQVINQQFCSFKIKLNTKAQTFCRNEYNITGLCSRQSCPLANSRYATVRAGANGTIYLYMKTIERAHLPSKLWERRKLSANYQTALKQIDEWLMYWPKFLQHKAKQRLTRLVQVAIRSRRLAKEEARLGETLVPKMAPKIRRREETRERKAEVAAKLERTIERELLMRLREGAYGDQPLNVSESIWKKVLHAMEREGEASRDKDMDTGIEEEGEEEADYEMEHEEDDGAVEYVSDIEESDEDDDIDDIESWLGSDDAAEDSESEDDASEEEAPKKPALGDKRKRGGPAPRQPKKVARRKGEREREVEYERGRDLAF